MGPRLAARLIACARVATGDLSCVTARRRPWTIRHVGRRIDAVSGEIRASSLQLAALDGEAVMNVVRGQIAACTTPPAEAGARCLDIDGVFRACSGRHTPGASSLAQHATFETASSTPGSDAGIQGFAVGTDWTMRNHWFAGVGGAYCHGKTGPRQSGGVQSTFTAPHTPRLRRLRERTLDGPRRRERRTNGSPTARNERCASPRGRRSGRSALRGRGPGGDQRARPGWRRSSGARSDSTRKIGIWSLLSKCRRAVRAVRAAGGLSENGALAPLSLTTAPEIQAFTLKQADVGVRFVRATGRFRPEPSSTHRRGLGERQTNRAWTFRSTCLTARSW